MVHRNRSVWLLITASNILENLSDFVKCCDCCSNTHTGTKLPNKSSLNSGFTSINIWTIERVLSVHEKGNLETRFINIQQDTLTFTDLTPVEQILKKFGSCFKVLEYGIHYQMTSKMPRLLVYSSMWSNHLWGSDRMQPKYLNTLYLYFPLTTLIYLNKYILFIYLYTFFFISSNTA